MIKRVVIRENILSANEKLAFENRALLDKWRTFSLNLMASPGAGKTSLIEATLKELVKNTTVAVIDGDLASNIDTDRAAAAGAFAIQINTGGECHLDAYMLHEVITTHNLSTFDLLIVENVGNLVCPVSFPLGTHKSVLIASIPEGDDKPYKYPGMYRGVDALVINKIDLLPYIPFSMEYFQKGVESLNPGLATFSLSCKSGEGLDRWISWVKTQIQSSSFLKTQ
jgi:hydrogenase nickel incorporation protein HypB